MLWFKKKQIFVSKQFNDSYNASHKGKTIAQQINEFQESGYEFVGIIGSSYFNNCNFVNILFRKT